MSVASEPTTSTGTGYAGIRILLLALFTVATAIVAVSFAANHLRSGFEREYQDQMNHTLRETSSAIALMIRGDDLVNDPVMAQNKYSAAIPAVLVDSGADQKVSKSFGLYAYTNGSLVTLIQSTSTGLKALEVPVSEWLTVEAGPYYIYDDTRTVVLTPIKDGQGKVTGLLEVQGSFSFLNSFGSQLERNVLLVVLLCVAVGIVLFSVQFILPLIVNSIRKKGGRG